MVYKGAIAIIPARGGSKGVPRKNIQLLDGIPLIGWSIEAAKQSGVFDKIIVSTDCSEIASVAKELGAEVPELRPLEISGDQARLRDAVSHIVEALQNRGMIPSLSAILLPTHPFRTPSLIRKMVELCYEHSLHIATVESLTFDPGFWLGRTGAGWESIQSAQHGTLYHKVGTAQVTRHNSQIELLPEWDSLDFVDWDRFPEVKVRPISRQAFVEITSPVMLTDIDSPEDLLAAQSLVKRNLVPWHPERDIKNYSGEGSLFTSDSQHELMVSSVHQSGERQLKDKIHIPKN